MNVDFNSLYNEFEGDNLLEVQKKKLLDAINMNKVMEKMGEKLNSSNNNLTMGYRILSSKLSNTHLSQLHQKMNNKTLTLLKRHVKKMNPLDQGTMSIIRGLYTTHPKFVASSKCIIEKIFQVPFEVFFLTEKKSNNNNIDNIRLSNRNLEYLEIKDELKEKLIRKHWMPFLIDHHHWITQFGICPIYFEPILIINDKSSNNNNDNNDKTTTYSVHYVPKTPIFENGFLYTFLDNNNKQNFIWQERNFFTSSIPPSMAMDGNGGGSGLSGGTIYSCSNTLSKEESLITSVDGKTNLNKKIYKLKESRYMLFSLAKNKTPSIGGKIIGDIAALIPEIELLNKMIAHQLLAGEKMINPSQFVENPIPNMNQFGSLELDRAKLVVDMEKVRRMNSGNTIPEFSTAFGVPTPHQMNGLAMDELFREIPQTQFDQLSQRLETIPSSDLFQTKKNYQEFVSHIEKVKQQYLNGEIGNPLPTEERMGIEFSDEERFYTLYQSGVHKKQTNKETDEFIRYVVKATNNPIGPEAKTLEILKKIKADDENKTPQNAKYLLAGQKIVNGNNPSMPNYNIKDQYSRIDIMINEICEFSPKETKDYLSKSSKTTKGIEVAGSMLRLSFRSLLNNNKVFIENLWELLIHVYLSDLIDKTNKSLSSSSINIKNFFINKIDFLQKTFVNINVEFVDATNDFLYKPDEYQNLYLMGFLDEEQYYKLMSDHYSFLRNKPFSNEIKNRIKEKASLVQNDNDDDNDEYFNYDNKLSKNNYKKNTNTNKRKKYNDGNTNEGKEEKEKKKKKTKSSSSEKDDNDDNDDK